METGVKITDWNMTGCPVCGGKQSEDVLNIPSIPTEVGLLQNTRQKALEAPQGRILLAFCLGCGFVGNRAYDESLVRWQPGYEISLHFSEVYQRFLEQLATRLIEKYQLAGKILVEVGCGQGHFVRLLGEMAKSCGYGFDPAMKKEDTISGDGYSIELLRDFYSENSDVPLPGFLFSRHVLHAVADPREFLVSLVRAIGSDRTIPVYFEVPNGEYIFGERPHWNYMYEYVSYFHASSLSRLFSEVGFDPQSVQPCYDDDQYLSIEALSREPGTRVTGDRDDLNKYVERVRGYRSAVTQQLETWKDRLAKWQSRRIVAWGAGGRAISFLSALAVKEQIQYVIDINPDRQNMYLPGTGQKVVTPNECVLIDPEIVIITNPTYELEIRRMVADAGCDPEFCVL